MEDVQKTDLDAIGMPQDANKSFSKLSARPTMGLMVIHAAHSILDYFVLPKRQEKCASICYNKGVHLLTTLLENVVDIKSSRRC